MCKFDEDNFFVFVVEIKDYSHIIKGSVVKRLDCLTEKLVFLFFFSDAST